MSEPIAEATVRVKVDDSEVRNYRPQSPPDMVQKIRDPQSGRFTSGNPYQFRRQETYPPHLDYTTKHYNFATQDKRPVVDPTSAQARAERIRAAGGNAMSPDEYQAYITGQTGQGGGKRGKGTGLPSAGMIGTHAFGKLDKTEDFFDKTEAVAARMFSTAGQLERGSNPLFIAGGVLNFMRSGAGMLGMAGLGALGAAAAMKGSSKFLSTQYEASGEYAAYRSKMTLGPRGPELTPQALMTWQTSMVTGKNAQQLAGLGTTGGNAMILNQNVMNKMSQDPGWMAFKSGIAETGAAIKTGWTNFKLGVMGIVSALESDKSIQRERIKEEREQRTQKAYDAAVMKEFMKTDILNERFKRGQVEAFQGIRGGGTAMTFTATPTEQQKAEAQNKLNTTVAGLANKAAVGNLPGDVVKARREAMAEEKLEAESAPGVSHGKHWTDPTTWGRSPSEIAAGNLVLEKAYLAAQGYGPATVDAILGLHDTMKKGNGSAIGPQGN